MNKPIEYILIPTKNGGWLRDSQGNPRMFNSASLAIQILEIEKQEWDEIKIYKIDDDVSREDFEKKVMSDGLC